MRIPFKLALICSALSFGAGHAQSLWDADTIARTIPGASIKEKTYVVYLNPFLIREESEKIISQKYNKQNYTEEAWEEILSEELENYEVSPGRQAVASKVMQCLQSRSGLPTRSMQNSKTPKRSH